MRIWAFAFLIIASFSSGCSMMIAKSGQDLALLTNREEVRRIYGDPVAIGIEDGKHYEDVRSHRRVVNEMEVIALGMYLPLIEIIALPVEILELAEVTIIGQTLRFVYDDLGNVEDVKRNGNSVYYMHKWNRRNSKSIVEEEVPDEKEANAKTGQIDPDNPRAATTPGTMP